MAELSGFRRYSNPAPRRGSLATAGNVQRGTNLANLQRGSIVSAATTTQTKGHSWCYVLKAMRRQSWSLSAGIGLCTCAIVINSHFYYFDILDKMSDIYDGRSHYKAIDVLAVSLYFVGACIGSITSGVYQYTWPARLSNYVIGVVLIVASGFLVWNTDAGSCIARILAGFSYGFIYISLITQIADNVMKSVRGYMASSLAQATLLGLIIGVGFTEQSWKTLASMKWTFYIVLFALPIMSIILNRFCTYEPITRLLKMNSDSEAKKVLDQLRNGKIDDAVIHSEIDERKLMLWEDYYISQSFGFQKVFSNGNGLTLLWLVLLRLLYILTSNMFLLILSAMSIDQDFNYLMHMLLMAVRLMVLAIPMYSIDKLGRRNLLLTSGLGSGILLLPFATHNMGYIDIRDDLLALITFGIHVFAALGIEPVQPIYAAEAFPLNQRNGSLAIITCIEYILQGIIAILLVCGEKWYLRALLISTPFLVLLLTIILFVKLPETKSMPLRKCRDQFNKRIVKRNLPPPRVSGVHTLGTTYM